MPKFRKKPVVIYAERFDDAFVAKYHGLGHVAPHIQFHDNATYLTIPTLEGVMRGERGDWIIKGVKGEFYPCKPDIFEATYEPA